MFKIKKILSKLITSHMMLSHIIRPFYISKYYNRTFDSAKYWEERYKKGGNSGAGSYGRLALFKAKIVNNFISKNNIKLVLELGCGDGNQLSLLKIPRYIGLDVSRNCINSCQKIFAKDKRKSFILYQPNQPIDGLVNLKADLTLSLDVIYHLVEDRIYHQYMNNLFSTSRKYTIIYSSNTDSQNLIQPQHIKHRNFTHWVDQNTTGWQLVKIINNNFPLLKNEDEESVSDFYIFQKVG